jgi:hypothetical protein
MKAEIIKFIKPNTKKIILAVILIALSFLITFNVTSPPTSKGQYTRPVTGVPLTYFTITSSQISAPLTMEPSPIQFFEGCNLEYCHFGLDSPPRNLTIYYWNTLINIIFWYIISALILLIYYKIKK